MTSRAFIGEESARGHTSTRTTCSIVLKSLVSVEIDTRKEMKDSQSSY